VQKVAPSFLDPFVSARQESHRFAAILSTPLLPSYGALEPLDQQPGSLQKSRVPNQPAFARRRQDVHPTIDPDALTGPRKRLHSPLALEARVPALSLAHQPGPAERGHRAPLAQRDEPDPGNLHLGLPSVELQRTVAVWKL